MSVYWVEHGENEGDSGGTTEVAAVVTLLISMTTAAASPPTDGAALTAECAATDWGNYMNCQRRLLDVRKAGAYCAPTPENGARYQYEFIAFARSNPAVIEGLDADAAAASYFDAHYACE